MEGRCPSPVKDLKYPHPVVTEVVDARISQRLGFLGDGVLEVG